MSQKRLDPPKTIHLGGGFKYFLFWPRTLGKWSSLTSIFFNWVETTNQFMVTSTIWMKFHLPHMPTKQRWKPREGHPYADLTHPKGGRGWGMRDTGRSSQMLQVWSGKGPFCSLNNVLSVCNMESFLENTKMYIYIYLYKYYWEKIQKYKTHVILCAIHTIYNIFA